MAQGFGLWALVDFPAAERYGLQAQLRRAAVSAASNIVEGCARTTTSEYLQFLNIAAGSAAEAGYLVSVAYRLDMLKGEDYQRLSEGYSELAASLQALMRALRTAGKQLPKDVEV